MEILQSLPQALLPWYRANRRELPWRQDKEPYHIWVSEIMLQQTRVEAVKGFYARFLGALPTVEALARCDDDALHKLWEGLGYYSRVRNMKKAANIIVEQYGGNFPKTYEEILALPGIGAYTAGAICSIAYDTPTPAVDGNVLRVMSRLTADETPIDLPACKARVQAQLKQIYPKQAGDFTQALMELGATVCGPNRKPDCPNCPCRGFCLGAKNAVAERLPVKSPKRGKRTEEKTVFILSCGGSYALEKRPDTGLLANLWQFPNASGTLELDEALKWLEQQGLKPRQVRLQVQRSHIFTHIRWEMRGFYIEVERQAGSYQWLTEGRVDAEAALPTAFRQFWIEEKNSYV